MKNTQFLVECSFSNTIPTIGLTDAGQESDFRWLNTAPLYYHGWAPNEPDRQTGENCVKLYGTRFADISCSVDTLFLCLTTGFVSNIFQANYFRSLHVMCVCVCVCVWVCVCVCACVCVDSMNTASSGNCAICWHVSKFGVQLCQIEKKIVPSLVGEDARPQNM